MLKGWHLHTTKLKKIFQCFVKSEKKNVLFSFDWIFINYFFTIFLLYIAHGHEKNPIYICFVCIRAKCTLEVFPGHGWYMMTSSKISLMSLGSTKFWIWNLSKSNAICHFGTCCWIDHFYFDGIEHRRKIKLGISKCWLTCSP